MLPDLGYVNDLKQQKNQDPWKENALKQQFISEKL